MYQLSAVIFRSHWDLNFSAGDPASVGYPDNHVQSQEEPPTQQQQPPRATAAGRGVTTSEP